MAMTQAERQSRKREKDRQTIEQLRAEVERLKEEINHLRAPASMHHPVEPD
jgi:cell division protein FtsB